MSFVQVCLRSKIAVRLLCINSNSIYLKSDFSYGAWIRNRNNSDYLATRLCARLQRLVTALATNGSPCAMKYSSKADKIVNKPPKEPRSEQNSKPESNEETDSGRDKNAQDRRAKISEVIQVIGGPLTQVETMTVGAARKRFGALGYELVPARGIDSANKVFELITAAQVQKSKKAAFKEMKKREAKLVQMSTKAAEHDRQIKLKHAVEIIEKGEEVCIKVRSKEGERSQRAEIMKVTCDMMRGKAKLTSSTDADQELVMNFSPLNQTPAEPKAKPKPLKMDELKTQQQEAKVAKKGEKTVGAVDGEGKEKGQ